jgi:hypothetical protein
MRIIVRQRPLVETPNNEVVSVRPLRIKVKHRPTRVLDFDIENRPLTYLGSDFTTAEVTAIAWAWTDTPEDVTVYLLGETDLPTILDRFLRVFHEADVVTGHYIRGHDLPMLNGALMELGRPMLTDKMVSDTKLDLVRSKGISLSQESLGGMLGMNHPKVGMDQTKWRAANRLTAEGLAEVRSRVVGDVRQHIEMRGRLLELGYLNPPRVWRSTSDIPEYVP